ncbi:hypothetical protein [Paenibacillus thalictri]|uniref:DUF2157 domain-containing protein n=1 Tax=Paenibacillus thalictri TaxID=2527873 RepID=A0A4Q9DP83_9BACL|nr:hypothetical protein [Paenibacillus thalictri]TBL78105.1 hypothetical protein EYB31_14555 [Paenibacillus thalictri]
MDEKKKIIVKEIEHWRRSKLLPEHYCDFLLNLYLEEHNQKQSGGWLGISPKAVRDSNWKIWIIVFGLLAIISFVSLNFNSFEFPLQIGVSIVFLIICYVIGAVKREKSPLLSHILFGVASLFLLFIGVYLLKQHDLNTPNTIVAHVVFCSFVWIMSGIACRLIIFQLCGWVGLVFAYGWLLHHQLDTITWGTLQLSWIPLSFLFVWIGWLVHQKLKQAGIVFLLLGCIVWFMPEFYGIMYSEVLGSEVLQLSLMGKIIIGGIMLFALRKKWTEWVA